MKSFYDGLVWLVFEADRRPPRFPAAEFNLHSVGWNVYGRFFIDLLEFRHLHLSPFPSALLSLKPV